MLDINGDLTEAIDNQIDEVVIENVFLKALKSDPESEQGGPFSGFVGKLMGDELIGELLGVIRLYATADVLAIEKGTTFRSLMGVSFGSYIRLTILNEIFDLFEVDASAPKEEDIITFDKDKAEQIISDNTRPAVQGLMNLSDIPIPASARFPELPSDLITNSPKLHGAITKFLNRNISQVDKRIKNILGDIKTQIESKNEELAQELEAAIASRTPSSATLPENINEEQLVTTVIDLEKLKSQEMNEIFLAQLGGAIELILGFMFDSKPLPLSITGAPRDVSAFARTIGSEKKYIEAARQYGLDHPSTYKNRAKLTNAIRKFEKQTGIKWPFK